MKHPIYIYNYIYIHIYIYVWYKAYNKHCIESPVHPLKNTVYKYIDVNINIYTISYEIHWNSLGKFQGKFSPIFCISKAKSPLLWTGTPSQSWTKRVGGWSRVFYGSILSIGRSIWFKHWIYWNCTNFLLLYHLRKWFHNGPWPWYSFFCSSLVKRVAQLCFLETTSTLSCTFSKLVVWWFNSSTQPFWIILTFIACQIW